MLSIGDFARHGRVSVRMLRHYDAVGLLRPASVDPATGYRSYRAEQLARLNRVVALKELGFTLEQVRQILEEKVSAEALRGMLTLRRAELERRIAADAARLASVEARLRLIESEGRMPTDEVVVKGLPAVRLAVLRGTAASYGPESITPVIRPLYDDLVAALDRCGVAPVGPGVAYYADERDGDGVVVHAGLPVTAEHDASSGFCVVDLPAVTSAATLIHHGSIDGVLAGYESVACWIEDNGYRPLGEGYARELYLATPTDDLGAWLIELQLPVEKV